ncbi:MAG TPA: glycosyltransferase family 39 protein [Candidatus Hydrogenedentes bacterium]|nr:glycosyltransferase family 39 protein [Candidatus Hydrogenedentota bacterium]
MSFVIVITAAAVMGAACSRTLKLGAGAEAGVCAFLLGMCGCALVALTVGSFSLGWTQVILAGIALAGLVRELSVYARRSSSTPSSESAKEQWDLLDYASVAAVGIALLVALIGALAPVTSWDATVAHIALPADYARAGHLYLEEGNVYSGYPQLMHALYAVAFFRGGEKPVTLLNWTMALAACWAIYALGARAFNKRTGRIAAAILATAPIFMDQAGGVSIDLAFTALSLAALTALLIWLDDPKRWQWLAISALLAGSACGVRHTGYLVCVLLGIWVLLSASGQRRKSTMLFCGVAVVAASPWLIRSAIVVGNPVFPFLSEWFPSHSMPHIAITGLGMHESVTQTGGNRLLALLRFPWDIIMRPSLYDGWSKSPGGLVLALGVPGLLIAGRRARQLGAYSIAGGICFFYFQRLARYILPFFAPMMVAAAAAAVQSPRFKRSLTVLLVASFVFGLVLHGAAVHFKIPVVLGMETRDEYLTRRVERYGAFQYANEHLNTGGVILTVDQRSYYLDAPAYQNHWGMKRLCELPFEQQLAWLREHNIKYVIIPGTFLRESGALKDVESLLNQWRADSHFHLLEEMTLPRIKGAGQERVDFYEINYE